MRVAQKFAGYTLEEADNLRKACGKKDRVLIAAEREKFEAGCTAQGYGDKLGRELFDIIEPFADYAFNKSHSYGYGLVAYQTAWLKVHHPVEYMAALLTSVRTTRTRPRSTWPSAAHSASRSSCPTSTAPPASSPARAAPAAAADEGDPGPGIVFGLAAVRNVGESLVERIVAEREAQGPSPTSTTSADGWTPSCSTSGPWSPWSGRGLRLAGTPPPGPLPGARRSGGPHDGAPPGARRRHRHPVLLGRAGRGRRRRRPLGGDEGADPEREFDKSQRLAFEKEMLGLYVSDHPLLGLEAALSRHTDCSLAELRDARLRPSRGRGTRGGRALCRRGGHRGEAPVHEKG